MRRKDITSVGQYVAVWAAFPVEIAKGRTPEQIRSLVENMCEGASNPANPESVFLYILGGNHNTASNKVLWEKYKGTERESEFITMTCVCWNSNFFSCPPKSVDDGLWVRLDSSNTRDRLDSSDTRDCLRLDFEA